METEPTPTPTAKKRQNAPLKLSGKERRFAQEVAKGASDADAYRRAYQPKTDNVQKVGSMAHNVAVRPRVQREIARLYAKVDKKALLTLDDRLTILADIAQTPGRTAGLLNAKARAIAVYSDISGDRAPTRGELTGPGGAPLVISAAAGPLVRQLSAPERLAEMKAARQLRLNPPAQAPVLELVPAPEATPQAQAG